MSEAEQKYLRLAVDEAIKGVRSGEGGPFGAVVVKDDGEVVAVSHNLVLQTNDPTNHAEIVAIRAACQKLGRFSLHDCVIYSSCEPCPMCFSAIHWAKMTGCKFASSAADAASVGFDDAFLYQVLNGTTKDNIDISRLEISGHYEPFEVYSNMLKDETSGKY
eukprot:c52354_g1_i1.p1 GENE.c52354_g1_i1~~c52354_g1_i1.p1  ORF type:complete len:171 (+),score=41.16 c52354_g1_i1:28-513(+)